MSPFDQIIDRLSPFPQHRAALEQLVESISAFEPTALGVKGSLAKGIVDRYSDIDFYVVLPDADSREALRERIFAAALQFGRPIASFPATHLGDPNMLVAFCESSGTIVKTDVNVVLLDEYRFTPDFITIAGQSDAIARRIVQTSPPNIDAVDVYDKMTGWMWYAYTKIARGERFEAAAALDFMRALALIPSLQFLHGLPAEGYRRLEQRLSEADQTALARTYAQELSPDELLRALLSLAQFFSSTHLSIVEKTGRDHRRADMSAIHDAIEADARSQGFASSGTG